MRKAFSRILAAGSAVAGFTLMATPVFAQSYYDYGYGYTGADAAASAGVLGFSFIYLLCICCIPLLVDSIIAYFVYNDAKKNNIDNPALWAVLCFFFTFFGLIIYFLIPRAEAMKKKEGKSETKSEAKSE